MEDKFTKGIKLIQGRYKNKNSDKSKEIAFLLFLTHLNQTEVFEKLEPNTYHKRKNNYYDEFECKRPGCSKIWYVDKNKLKTKEKNKKTKKVRTIFNKHKDICPFCRYKKISKRNRIYKSSLNTNIIQECFKTWNECFFFDKQIEITSKKPKGFIHYRFNLKPFFIHCKLSESELSPQECNILNFLINHKQVRLKMYNEFKQYDFLTAIIKFYLKYFYIANTVQSNELVDWRKISSKKYDFNKKFLDLIISPQTIKGDVKTQSIKEQLDQEKKLNQKNMDIPIVNTKLTKEEILIEENTDKLFYYDNPPFKKINGKYHLIDFDKELFLHLYNTLHKNFKSIMKELDKKMLMLDGYNYWR